MGGVGITMSVQVATFLHTLRRMDQLQLYIGEVWGGRRSENRGERTLGQLEGLLFGRQEVGNEA